MTVHLALSGGMDSTGLATMYVNEGYDVIAYGFDYGQRHARELASAQEVADRLDIPFWRLPLTGILGGSALLGETDVPDGHYAEDSMTATVVNGRNLLFVSALVAKASAGDTVALAVHGGDHFIYPDCRPTFVNPLAQAIFNAYGIYLAAPFITGDKADIIRQVPDAPYEVSWSCYKGGEVHCGRCGTCVERAEAFALADVADPTVYADAEFWRQAVASR
jgi:7-cyano-7-deazaguanine synthase